MESEISGQVLEEGKTSAIEQASLNDLIGKRVTIIYATGDRDTKTVKSLILTYGIWALCTDGSYVNLGLVRYMRVEG